MNLPDFLAPVMYRNRPRRRWRKKEDQTERYLAALQNPDVQILGHPRGRTAQWPSNKDEANCDASNIGQEIERQLSICSIKLAAQTQLRSDQYFRQPVPSLRGRDRQTHWDRHDK